MLDSNAMWGIICSMSLEHLSIVGVGRIQWALLLEIVTYGGSYPLLCVLDLTPCSTLLIMAASARRKCLGESDRYSVLAVHRRTPRAKGTICRRGLATTKKL